MCTRDKHRKNRRGMEDLRAEVKGFIWGTISEGITIFSEDLGLSWRRWRERGHTEGISGHPTVLETRLEPRQNHKLVNPKNFKWSVLSQACHSCSPLTAQHCSQEPWHIQQKREVARKSILCQIPKSTWVWFTWKTQFPCLQTQPNSLQEKKKNLCFPGCCEQVNKSNKIQTQFGRM